MRAVVSFSRRDLRTVGQMGTEATSLIHAVLRERRIEPSCPDRSQVIGTLPMPHDRDQQAWHPRSRRDETDVGGHEERVWDTLRPSV